MELPDLYIEDGMLKQRENSAFCGDACDRMARLYPGVFNIKVINRLRKRKAVTW